MRNETLIVLSLIAVFSVLYISGIESAKKRKTNTNALTEIRKGRFIIPELEPDSIAYFVNNNVVNMNTITKSNKAVNKHEATLQYIKRYKKVAQDEMRIYKIPASITLAQGILESGAGLSELSSKDNNHFGIKCKSCCISCLCRNYEDDDKCDMFRVFNSPWESFREHSKLLTGARYKSLFKYGTNYKKWAYGLKKCGYATAPNYAQLLISIIEKHKLYQYDKVK